MGVLNNWTAATGGLFLSLGPAGHGAGSPGTCRNRSFPQPIIPVGLFHKLPGDGQFRIGVIHAEPQHAPLLQALANHGALREPDPTLVPTQNRALVSV